MFGAEVSSRFLEKWNTSFKEKVIQEARNLKETDLLKQLLKAVLNDDSILFQILYLMPIFKQIVYKWTFMLFFSHAKVFMTISWPLKETLNHILLLQGLQKHRFSPFTLSWTEKFCLVSHVHPWVRDELFNFVFSVKYHDALSSLYTFLQTTMYKIDKGTTEETPKVKERRARLLNKQ